jgi:Na+:H+ antiporter, NhaA family
MVLPALIYTSLNFNTTSSSGWGIPMATDIAFALGVLSLLGKRVPFSLKIMLTALAIVDDLGAILVIAIFYSSEISLVNLSLALGTFVVLAGLGFAGVRYLIVYILLGILMWYFTLKSGIHATIAGVLLAFAIPLGKGKRVSAAETLEHFLHKPVSFFIMPVFAIANTGFVLNSDISTIFTSSASLGIILGLLIGKPVGIALFSWIAVKMKLAGLPSSATWTQLIGIGFLGGIGYTMSIFIALLAFDDLSLQSFSKAAILSASVLSGIVGFIILKKSTNS